MPYEAHIDFKYERTTTMEGVFDNAFTITSLENNNIIAFNQDLSNAGFIYSLDGGMSWQSVTSATICTLNAGESVMIRNTSPITGPFNCPWPRLFSTEMKDFNVSGNIMSLLTKDYKNFNSLHYVDEEEDLDFYFDSILQFVFAGTSVVDASNLILPATELSDHCYYRMFNDCTKLQTAPKLPATTLADWCYANMFQGCTSLKECPELSATLLPSYCYACMFGDCTSLVATPEFPDFELMEGDTNQLDAMFENCTGIVSGPVLSCDTLTENCYVYMFSGCTNMINPPVLKATNLAYGCYERMFESCTSLVNAPELPAIDLPEMCYAYMFINCSNLSYIKIYAINRESNSLQNWVENVAPTGVFVKQQGVTYPIDSIDGVPIGWTIYELGDQIYDMYAVSLSVDPEGAGTVSGAGRYMRTTNVTVTALPDNDHLFDHWEVNGLNVSNDAIYTFRMNYDIHLTAKFVVDTNIYANMYFTIESLSKNNSIYIRTYETDEPFKIYYKINDVWTSYEISNPQNEDVLITTLNKHDILCLASNKTSWDVPYTTAETNGGRIVTTGNYMVYGNLLSMTLYDEEEENDDSVFYYDEWYEVPFACFRNFFRGSESNVSNLLNAANLSLPAYTVEEQAYACMFQDCTKLLYAPKRLYASTLDAYCYYGMLEGCSSLITVPILNATILETGCYEYMFKDCISLTRTPVLPAQTLEAACYEGMFYGCTSLTTPPALPATTLAENCYYDMFCDCTSLTSAPTLPATSMEYECYGFMFQNCTSLTTPPELPATTLSDNCYEAMFYGCTSLTTAPDLPATNLHIYCYQYMFYGCTSLTTAPDLPATDLVQNCYQYMFYNCENLNYIKILALNRASNDLNNWVHNVAPSGIFVKDINNSTYLIDNDSGVPIGWTIVDEGEIEHYYNVTIINNHPTFGEVFGAGRYAENTTVTIRAIAAQDYSFKRWMYNGIELSTNYEFSFTATQDVTITVIWDRHHDYDHEYLTLESLSDNNKVYLNYGYYYGYVTSNGQYIGSEPIGTVQYCINETPYWTTYEITAKTNPCCTLNTGDYIKIKNLQYYDVQSLGVQERLKINCDKSCEIYGNIMSLYEAHLNTSQSTIDRYVGQNLSVLANNETFIYLFSRMGDPGGYPSYINLKKYRLISAKNLILPATTLSTRCYWGMFYDEYDRYVDLETAVDQNGDYCVITHQNKSIVMSDTPNLPATTLATQCYWRMFCGCTLLTTPPVLPATTLAPACYSGMFMDCTLLRDLPALPATTLAPACYESMLDSCISLTTIPSGYLPATTLPDNHYIDGNNIEHTAGCYMNMFTNCTSLTTIPSNLLPATTLAPWCYMNMFTNCTSLTTIPSNLLPANTLTERCYSRMFEGCTSLTTPPALSATTLANDCYEYMFKDCTSLATAPALPATTLTYSCYIGMFYNCTSLTTAPVLPATTLWSGCYDKMFYNCTSLNYIKAMFLDIYNGGPGQSYPAVTFTDEWVYNVAQYGTYVKNVNARPYYNTYDGSSIPYYWTVQTASE